MGLFGKRKTSAEILAEGRTQFESGDFKMAFLTLHGLANKGEPEASYYIGLYWLREKNDKGMAKKYLITAAKAHVRDAAQLLAAEYAIQDYLSKDTVSQAKPEPKPEPHPAPQPVSDARDCGIQCDAKKVKSDTITAENKPSRITDEELKAIALQHGFETPRTRWVLDDDRFINASDSFATCEVRLDMLALKCIGLVKNGKKGLLLTRIGLYASYFEPSQNPVLFDGLYHVEAVDGKLNLSYFRNPTITVYPRKEDFDAVRNLLEAVAKPQSGLAAVVEKDKKLPTVGLHLPDMRSTDVVRYYDMEFAMLADRYDSDFMQTNYYFRIIRTGSDGIFKPISDCVALFLDADEDEKHPWLRTWKKFYEHYSWDIPKDGPLNVSVIGKLVRCRYLSEGLCYIDDEKFEADGKKYPLVRNKKTAEELDKLKEGDVLMAYVDSEEEQAYLVYCIYTKLSWRDNRHHLSYDLNYCYQDILKEYQKLTNCCHWVDYGPGEGTDHVYDI